MMAVARWMLFAALVWAIGCVAVRWLVVGSSGQRRIARTGAAWAGVAVLALLALGAGQLFAFRDPFSPLGREAGVLLGTSWGRVWSVGLAAAVGLTLAFVIARRSSRGGTPAWIAASVLTIALAFYPSLTGHALGSERLTALAILFDGVHVLSAGAWIGSLAVLLTVYLRASAEERLPPISVALPRFSRIAVVSVFAVVSSGGFAAWLHLPSLDSLFASGYGRLLVAKVALVLLVAGLGRVNWKRWRRERDSGGEIELPGRAALVEVAIAHAVLAITAVLVSTPPPMVE